MLALASTTLTPRLGMLVVRRFCLLHVECMERVSSAAVKYLSPLIPINYTTNNCHNVTLETTLQQAYPPTVLQQLAYVITLTTAYLTTTVVTSQIHTATLSVMDVLPACISCATTTIAVINAIPINCHECHICDNCATTAAVIVHSKCHVLVELSRHRGLLSCDDWHISSLELATVEALILWITVVCTTYSMLECIVWHSKLGLGILTPLII